MTSAAATDGFLAAFFGEGNDLSLTALAQDAPQLAAWLDARLAQVRREPGAAHVLPRRIAGQTRWYVLAHSDRQLKELSRVLEAFVVPAYARVDRHVALDGNDSVDAAVMAFTGGHALVLDVLPGQQQQVRRALELFGILDARRPRRQLALSRPLGRLLREFEMAVLASEEGASGQLLREVEQTGQLSAQNLTFLRIRRLAGLRQFEAILGMPELATVLAIRRPARVSANLLEAVYVTELARYEADGDPEGALRHFSDVVLSKYPALYKSRHGLQTPEAVKSFMLHAVAVRPGDAESRAQLLASPDLSEADRRFAEQLAGLAQRPAPRAITLADAVSAAHAGNYDAALHIADSQPASVERAELLIRCAYEIDSIDAMKVAAVAVRRLDPGQRGALVTSRLYATLWAHISEELAGTSSGTADEGPGSWAEWFRQAVEGRAVPNAIQIAERAVVEWSTEDFSAQDSQTIAGLLSRDIAPQPMRLVKDALPHFLAYIDRASEPAWHRELLDDIAVLLMSEEDLGVADVQVIANLSGLLLEIGLSSVRYRQLVEDFCALWQRVESPAISTPRSTCWTFSWPRLAPIPESGWHSSGNSSPATSAGSAESGRINGRCLQNSPANSGNWKSCKAVRPAEDQSDGVAVAAIARDALAGKVVAIYTLTDAAAARAADFLTRHFDDVTVQVANDHVASDRLRALARAADVFVVATRSAKHAATTFIEAQRPHGRPILYAAGKGSASLIRAVYSYASS